MRLALNKFYVVCTAHFILSLSQNQLQARTASKDADAVKVLPRSGHEGP
jgi:hypothetical protein